ncbi:hypothetical protein JCM1841_003265 [Sporobolomyces salmonicolor]
MRGIEALHLLGRPPTSPTLASYAHQPSAPPSGSGFKLTLKLGGQPAAQPSPAPPAPPPAVPAQAPPPSAPVASHSAGGVVPPMPGATRGAGPSGAGPIAQQPDRVDGEDDGERRVSATKYRALKRKYLEAVESRDDASLALFRAQKLIHRLREDKSSLLDRVLELEIAAGITSADVTVARDTEFRTERELAFPLLHPPSLPSLEDRQRQAPVITTTTDLTNANYNQPSGPPPLPKTFPPRQRSQHLQTTIAAQKLRDELDAKLSAQGLSRPAFPAVTVLGVEGSTIATNVERALAGEMLEVVSEQPRGNKRRRESSMGAGSKGKARASVAPPPVVEQPALQHLPNPFAAAGAVPEGTAMMRNNAEALAASQAAYSVTTPAYTAPAAVPAAEYDVSMDDGQSVASLGFSDGEGEDYKPTVAARKAGRKSGYDGPEKLAKPKKVRAHGITSGTYNIPHIPRNADGTPRLPMPIGTMTLKNLGVVDPREAFHTERYIFPVGYEATRKYPSMVDRAENAEYVCRIVDGGDGMPRFELHPSDQPGYIISAGTPTGAWTQVVKAANKLRERNHSNSVSGPDYYGLSQNQVKAMIQELPGANQVPGYIWQTFVEDAAPALGADDGKGRRGPGGAKKVIGARRKYKSGDGMEGGAAYAGIEVEDASAYGQADNGMGYHAGGGEYGSVSYDSPAGYAQSMSPVESSGYPSQDYSQPASLSHLLQAAATPDPYSLPPFGDAAAGGGAPIDPFLGGGAAAPNTSFDPYAIPPAQPAGGFQAIDPAFGAATGGQYGQNANAFAYELPVGGQEYATSEESSP